MLRYLSLFVKGKSFVGALKSVENVNIEVVIHPTLG